MYFWDSVNRMFKLNIEPSFVENQPKRHMEDLSCLKPAVDWRKIVELLSEPILALAVLAESFGRPW